MSLFTITQNDLVSEENSPPVAIKKRDYSQTYNRVEVSWSNRTQNYDVNIAMAQDEVDQRISGKVRKKTISLTGITQSDLAQKMAYRLLFEGLYRFSYYTFTVSFKNMILEVGDVGYLSDGYKINLQRIRITSISEGRDGGTNIFEAVEDMPYMYKKTDYQTQVSQFTPSDTTVTLVQPKVTFVEHLTEKAFGIFIAPQGQYANGFLVFKSFDNISYDYIDAVGIVSVEEANAYGTVATALNTSAPAIVHRPDEFFDVDLGNYCEVQSASGDDTVIDDNFFNGRHLAKIGNEIIAYRDVEDLGSGVWRISNLIRGMFLTKAVTHIIGEDFYTLDLDFTYVYSNTDIGRTIYFKFLTFYGTTQMQLADVTNESYTIDGEYKRPAPASLLRINGRQGFQDYTTDPFTLEWELGSKVAGWNIDNLNWDDSTIWQWTQAREASGEDPIWNDGVLFGESTEHADASKVILRVEQTDGTLIGEEELVASDISESINKTIDLGSSDITVIKIIPATSFRSKRENLIMIQDMI